MTAALDDFSAIKHQNLMGINNGAEAVSDYQHSGLTLDLLNGLLHQTLTLAVKGTGGLIKN